MLSKRAKQTQKHWCKILNDFDPHIGNNKFYHFEHAIYTMCDIYIFLKYDEETYTIKNKIVNIIEKENIENLTLKTVHIPIHEEDDDLATIGNSYTELIITFVDKTFDTNVNIYIMYPFFKKQLQDTIIHWKKDETSIS